MFKEELVIIRHARSETNVRMSEDLNCPITKFGEGQAYRVGQFMAKHMRLSEFTFFTSPFLRCLQTSWKIWEGMSQHGLWRMFNVERRLREYINHCGREVTIPLLYDFHESCKWDSYHTGQARFEKAPATEKFNDEHNEEFLNRMHDLYRSLPQKSVVVTHGLPARLLLHIAANPHTNSIPIWDHSIDNCSISYVVNGRVVWHGRSLYHEIDYDPFDKRRPFDAADLLTPKP